MKAKVLFKTAMRFADKHLPAILAGAALISELFAVSSAISKSEETAAALTDAKIEKTEKLARESQDEHALDIYRNEEGELDLKKVKLNLWEKIKTLAPIHWTTGVITVISGACIIFGYRVSAKRYAALLALCLSNEKRLKEYQGKVKELFGEKKEKEIREEIAKDEAMDISDEVVKASERYAGMYPCYLKFSNTPLIGDITGIERGFNMFNNKYLMRENEGSIADLMDCITEFCVPLDDNMFKCDTWLSSRTVWEYDGNASNLLKPEITYGSTLSGVPCLIVDVNRPADSYNRIM